MCRCSYKFGNILIIAITPPLSAWLTLSARECNCGRKGVRVGGMQHVLDCSQCCVYECPSAAVTNYHTHNGLKHPTCIISQFSAQGLTRQKSQCQPAAVPSAAQNPPPNSSLLWARIHVLAVVAVRSPLPCWLSALRPPASLLTEPSHQQHHVESFLGFGFF